MKTFGIFVSLHKVTAHHWQDCVYTFFTDHVTLSCPKVFTCLTPILDREVPLSTGVHHKTKSAI